jgi:hypothetical protein
MSLITKKGFEDYMNSQQLHEDLAAVDTSAKPPPPAVSGVTAATEDLTVLEFRWGVKRDKTHYEDLKDDKFFNTWNRGFVTTAHMHHTHLVLDIGSCCFQGDADIHVRCIGGSLEDRQR